MEKCSNEQLAGSLPYLTLRSLGGWEQQCSPPTRQAVANAALPVFLHLRRMAADGEVVYSDDTRVKILSCLKENEELEEVERRGAQTSGILVKAGSHWIALYANGRRHAGENLNELLKKRSAGLETPIQMIDEREVTPSYRK